MSNSAVTVELGDMADTADARVRMGQYASLSDVVREGLRRLDRDEGHPHDLGIPNDVIRAKLEEAHEDPWSTVSIDEAFASIRSRLEARWAAEAA